MSKPVTVISVTALHELFRAQGVKRREDIAFKCARCGTVQSLASFAAIGVPTESAERQIGFSCIGRHDPDSPSGLQPGEPGRGCDWTLGGLFQLHTLEVETPDGQRRPSFWPASAEEAQALAQQNAAQAVPA